MACEHKYVNQINEYFDGNMSHENEMQLKHHLMTCESCQKYFRELNDVHRQLGTAATVSSPPHLKEQIMDRIPRSTRKDKFFKTVKEHPFITACAIFLVVIFTTSFIEFQSNQSVYVSEHEGIRVDGNHVTIPEGEIIFGDLTIENAIVDIQGEIQGDLTLVNSELASADYNVHGQIFEVNRFFRWVTFRLSREVVNFFQQFSY